VSRIAETGQGTDAHLGPALDPEIFARIQALRIRTRRTVTEVMAGEYESAFKGKGMEFEQVREYQAGDDLRLIDWNVTARTGIPHVKEHREERELTVLLLVDLSASGAFGSALKRKSEVTAEVAAVLAYTAIRSNDRVGLILFTDTIELYIPPKKGRSHVWRVIREILAFRPSGRGTDLARALEYMGRVTPRRVVAFMLSDFLIYGAEHQRFEDRLRVASRRHDLTAVRVLDRREEELPPVGLLQLQDAESGETVLLDTRSRRARQELAARVRNEDRLRGELFRAAGVGEVRVTTDEPCVDALMRYFRARERRR